MAQTSLIFGDSGSYKTTAIGHAAKYIYERTGKTSRMITAEPGWATLRDLRDAGILEVFNIAQFPNPLPLLRKLSEGYWPDGLNGEGAMTTTRLRASTAATWEKVGLIALEGLTSGSDLLMRDQTAKGRTIKGEGIGEFVEKIDLVGPDGKPLVDVEKFAFNTQNHYGFTQNEMIARVVGFGALPVERVIFSAHEAKGEEEDTRRAIRGPALAGKAATDRVLKYVGDCLHFEVYSEEKETKDTDGRVIRFTQTKVRVFFQNHPDPAWAGTGLPVFYKCKPRVIPSMLGILNKRWPGGYFNVTPEHGLDEYLKLQDLCVAQSVGGLEEWKKKADEERVARAKAILAAGMPPAVSQAQAQAQAQAPTQPAISPAPTPKPAAVLVPKVSIPNQSSK